ncbi:MAG: aromatic ring-hydroxylating dioxygenase subunit alpha [Acidimicrobiales bacterium]
MSATAVGQLLAPEAYWSPEWFASEQRLLFGRCWNFLGPVDDVPLQGALAATVAGQPVLLERTPPPIGSDSATGFATGLRGRSGAQPVAVDVWAGFVFVHLDPDHAIPLASWLGDFGERIGGFRPERLSEVARHTFEVAANWKFFVENHVDVYHLWHLHKDSLGAYDHHNSTWEAVGPHWVFYEPPRPEVDTSGASFWRGLSPIDGIGPERWGSGAHLIFPNLTLATGAGFFMTYQCIPVAADRSVVDIRIRAEAGWDATDVRELSCVIIEAEDGAACEAMQAGVRSPWFGVGPLADTHERPIVQFQANVAAAMA